MVRHFPLWNLSCSFCLATNAELVSSSVKCWFCFLFMELDCRTDMVGVTMIILCFISIILDLLLEADKIEAEDKIHALNADASCL